MKKLYIFLMIFAFAADIIAQTDVSGLQSGIWALANSPYRVIDTVTVATGTELVIEPGVEVAYTGWFPIIVNGTLTAVGTETDSITFHHEVEDPDSVTNGIDFVNANSNSILQYCHIEDGYDDMGAGILIDNSSPTIRNCLITKNRGGYGGGIFCIRQTTPIIAGNVISHNSTNFLGGGVAINGVSAFYGSHPYVHNNIFHHNQNTAVAGAFGGGALSLGDYVNGEVINNTFYNNTTLRHGGAIRTFGTNSPDKVIRNNVFWGNTADSADQIAAFDPVTLENNLIQGGYPDGSNTIDSDPLFANAANGDFRYEVNSPLVDAGSATGAPSDDFDGNARPFDGDRDEIATVDIGAFEYHNTVPVVDAIADASIAQNELFSYASVVTDPDLNEVITYVLTEAPGFLSVDSDGVISGTPDNGDVGTYPVTLVVADSNNALDTASFSITVANMNDAPTVANAIADQQTDEDEEYDFTFAANVFNDVDAGDNLTYSATLSDDSDLPVWLTFTPGTRNFNGTPTNAEVGSITIKVTATDDSSASVFDEFDLEVVNVNDAPVVTDIGDQEIAEGASFATIDLDDYVSDVDNSDAQINWTYSGNTSLSIDIDAITRIATITAPNADWFGEETITFTATDPGDLEDSDAATFTITAVNDAPVVLSISNQTIDEGFAFETITLDNFVSDVDNNDNEMTWTYSGNTELTVNISAGRVATVSIPDINWSGSETITFTATDPGDLFDEVDVIFTVNAVNDAPNVAGIPDQQIAEGATFATINLDDYISDADNADSEMEWIYSGNSELTVSISAARVATITIPNINWNGGETITFEASDPGGASDDDAATFTVTAVNDAPVVTNIPGQSIAEGGTFNQIDLSNYVSDVDNTDEEITWTYSGNTELLVNITGSTATVSTPNVNWNGQEIITFIATDPGDASDSDPATFTVTSENDAPIVSNIPDQTVNEGASFTTITLDDYVADADHADNQITWSFSGEEELSVSIDGSRVATITIPNANWNGSETITFTAEDPDGLSNSDDAVFTVTAVNDAPVVADIPAQTIAEGESFTNISLDGYVADVDNADNTIVWTYSGNTELTVAINESNRVATITIPSADWNGSEVITFTATDPGDLSDSDTVAFTVTAVNDAPVVSDIGDQTIDEGNTFTTITLDDFVEDLDNADSEIVWQSVGAAELVVTIDENRIATIAVPSENWNGSETITFTASDPGDLSDSDTASFTVNAVNDAPLISDIIDRTVQEGSNFPDINLDSFVSDVDNADSEITWTFSGNNNLLVEVDSNRVLHVMPENADWFGSEKIFFTATDPGAMSAVDSATFTVTAVNDAPVIVSLPAEVTFPYDTTVVIPLEGLATDIDSPVESLTWVFTASSDSLLIQNNPEDDFIVISAIPGFSGDVEVYGTVTDDSAASDTDTILVHVDIAVSIEDIYSKIPLKYELQQNFPNPFNPSTKIRFGLPKAGELKLEVYNIIGQKVATLYNGFKEAGYHILEYDASQMASGIYFYRIEAGKYQSIKKMILIK